MTVFIVAWEAQVDSKGRVTMPAEIRNRLDISEKDRVSLGIKSSQVVRREVESEQEALQVLSSFDSVKSFQYTEGVLEVVIDG